MSANKSGTTHFRLEPTQLSRLSSEQAAKLDAAQIDYSDIPELPDAFWHTASNPISDSKTQITLRLDTDVLDFFRATGKRYQTRMNAILRAYTQTHMPSTDGTSSAEFQFEVHESNAAWGKDIGADAQATTTRSKSELEVRSAVAIEDYLSLMKSIRETVTPSEFVSFLEAQRKLQLVVETRLQALLDKERQALIGATKMTTSIGSEVAVAVIKAAIAAANTTYDTVRSASMQAVDLAEHSFKASSAVASQADKRAASRAAKKP